MFRLDDINSKFSENTGSVFKNKGSRVLLYIHGFGSCGSGQKVDVLRQCFGDDEVLSPDLPICPLDAMTILENLIDEHPVDLMLGSSLGGYYAEWLNGCHKIPSVLINPAVKPYELLTEFIGTNQHWCTGEPFELTSEHVENLKQYSRREPGPDEHYLVLLHSDDEVLDYRVAAERYRDFNVVIEQGGNHRFENLDHYLAEIEAFRNANQ